jgi:class 3 adenylate cyclase
MSALEMQAKSVKRALLKRPQTAAELAARAGFGSGRAISRAIGVAVRNGDAVAVSRRPARYTKV